MKLRYLVRKQLQMQQLRSPELTLPGDPMIYSIKYLASSKNYSIQFSRNHQWRSIFKCYFKAYLKTNVPVVLLIRFYTKPPEYKSVPKKLLKTEKCPAVFSFELCDYLLSFMEMMHKVLINSYRQIVKIDMEKYYSDNPRTVFKFMKWDEYVEHYIHDSFASKTESLSETRSVQHIQPKREGNDRTKKLHKNANT